MCGRRCSAWTLFLLASLAANSVFAGEHTVTAPKSCTQEGIGNVTAPLWVPPGTISWYEDRELRFQVPQDYVIWARNLEGTFEAYEESGVKCECAEGDCSPVLNDGTIYCMVGPKCTSSCKRKEAEEMAFLVTPRDGGIRLATREERLQLPLAPSRLLDIPAVMTAIEEFNERVYRERIPADVSIREGRVIVPRGYKLVSVNLFGYLASVLVPRDVVKRAESSESIGLYVEEYEDEEEKPTCKCNAGTGCTYWKKWTVQGCDAGSCTSCEMNAQ